jgi:hypothetical protein
MAPTKMEPGAMPEQEPEFDCLGELVRRRNRLAYELAGASERERCTVGFLAKERMMNAHTLRIEQLRRAKKEQEGHPAGVS